MKNEQRENSNRSIVEDLPQQLSPEFKEVLEEERIQNRAWAMVDGILEEMPNLDSQQIFQEALQWLKEHPEEFSSESISKGNPKNDDKQ
ncbi:MAG: hypothetical protein V1808_04745 [Candidatus Daviesbacteria bacterium]